MYRRLSPRQREARARKIEAMRRGRDAARMARQAPGRAPDLPALRREVIVIDHDTGQPVQHVLRLYRTRRVDVYCIEADGAPWRTGGWTRALDGLRRAYPRVPSPRSDFWSEQ
jgi:hypothetical protein